MFQYSPDTPRSRILRWSRRTLPSVFVGTQVLTDMPTELGGSGDKVTRGWLFRARLASCLATCIALGAAAEGIELASLEVLATSRSDLRGLLGMADSTGAPVGAGPGEIQLRVRISAAGARLEQVLARRPRQLVYDGGGATTRLVCGYLACDSRLAGVGDRIVGPALNAIHSRPAHAWTLEELAHGAGTSRSVLAERFQNLVGSSPIQYLTQWRMLLAGNLLCRSNAPLARIAEEVGYQTDTAFSRAFRRAYGSPPASWRRSQLTRDHGP